MRAKKVLSILGVLQLLLFMSCAGPTHPWGNHGFKLPPKQSEVPLQTRTLASMATVKSDATIKFYPRRQNFHQTTEFSLTIEDPEVIPSNAEIALFYNGVNVTNSWLKKSIAVYNENQTLLTLTFHGLKLPADREHDILVRYQRKNTAEVLTKPYLGPTCSLADLEPLGTLNPFGEKEPAYRALIEGISSKEGVNPSLIAGLIAQESAFNPFAVSSAKAIGLTQVTDAASHHIIEVNQNFSAYPELKNYPVPLIKTMILAGTINKKNEWRLDPKKSVLGGIHYLKFVENYWLLPENHMVMLKHFNEEEDIIDDLILASYNSGPYRVKKALRKRGKDWIQSPHLNEARKYVKRVKSYCYHFATNNGRIKR